MPTPIDPAAVQQVIDKLTVIGVLGWGVLAFVMGWVVPRSVHEALRRDRDELQKRHDKMLDVAELALRSRLGNQG